MTSRRVTSLEINKSKDEKGDLFLDFHSIVGRWRNYFFHLLNVHGVNDVRQTKIHSAELIVSEPSTWSFNCLLKS
jgi:hypothetical protein